MTNNDNDNGYDADKTDNERAFEAGKRGELPPDDLWPPPGEGLMPRFFYEWREGFREHDRERRAARRAEGGGNGGNGSR